jgi:hypothetical protein
LTVRKSALRKIARPELKQQEMTATHYRPILIPEFTGQFLAYCARHRAPATLAFYRTRLKKFCEQYNAREFGTLTPLEIDQHLAEAGTGLSIPSSSPNRR